MSASTATALLIASCAALLWVCVSYARYRVTHRFSELDVKAARRDAANRSRSVVGGRAGEQMAPHLAPFCERYDAADARFVGAPVDYVVFDGLCGGELREIVFVEVKTGRAQLNANERDVERALREGRVAYEVVRLDLGAHTRVPSGN